MQDDNLAALGVTYLDKILYIFYEQTLLHECKDVAISCSTWPSNSLHSYDIHEGMVLQAQDQ